MRIASIDIGTNTVRLLIGELSGGIVKKLLIERRITRLGEGFKKNGGTMIQSAMDRTLKALIEFKRVLEDYGVEQTRAVATSVVRESDNGNAFKKRVKSEAGIDIEIISGEEEAEITVMGVLGSVHIPTSDCIIFDIGGGSTEYILVRENHIKCLKSLPIGVVYLTEKYLTDNISNDSELTVITQYIDSVLEAELKDFEIRDLNNLTLVGTAGTPTTLAAIEQKLVPYDPQKVNGFVLSKSTVERILEMLSKMTPRERLNVPGLEEGREDLIIAGTLTVLSTFSRFSKDRLIVSDGGLLEGGLYSIIQNR